MILEALSYFYIIREGEFVPCDSEGLRERSRVLFTIILGEGNSSPDVKHHNHLLIFGAQV
jgi:hypothetical protein